ncbi:sensor histidine kinase [Actinoplanes derwentensis]|uniref:histidine kinase n=1 Tax=Actinoplanes derwentensis TaxID=113562 RepID=A0A1H2D7S8_9ACTN|nr:sensor histidine kinase [Actinoplanes derwentensis]GID86316.1 two-component sensor histidine kinase [Actinoplanes derwentensis]SDT78617.1 Signal transduction histidine kinase [Actinoplanes derwentensis]
MERSRPLSIRLWELYYLVVALALAVAIALLDGYSPIPRMLAVGAIAGMAALYLLGTRPRILSNRQNTLVAAAYLPLFALAVACVPHATWMLFAVIPIFFMTTALRTAVVLVVIVNIIPVVLELRAAPGGIALDLMIAVISTAAGVCMGVWITRMAEQSNQRAQLIAELEASRAELARLSHEAGVAAERNRLAGEIHDTLAQGFTSIITLIQAVDPVLRDERLALAVRTARENLTESRAMVAALTPSALTSASLPFAVRRSTARFTEESGVPCSFRITGDERALPTRAEVVLLRAAQESLTNVRRHAGAQETAVVLAYTPTSVRLVARDDGCGFDPATSSGFGLSGMRARASELGGTLVIRSSPADGTVLELEIPA